MNKVTKPTLLLIKKKAVNNIQRMAEKAKNSKVTYRPHFKTHISKEIGSWYREVGVTCITVSSIDMAVYFAAHGWDDITIAFPVNVLQIEVLKYLSKQVQLTLVVTSTDTVEIINSQLHAPVNICIKIDTGYHRSGIWHEETQEIKQIIDSIASPHSFGGLLAHFGHTYKETEPDRIKVIYQEGISALAELKRQLPIDSCRISVGDTPSCSLVDDFGEVDEIRPGNLVFYDVMQAHIGSCTVEDIAVCLAVPVVDIHLERCEVVVHGGAVHLSKESILGENGKPSFGQVVTLNDRDWSVPLANCYVKSLSQEHGIISMPKEVIEQIKIGTLLGILPIHSCLTANLMKEYQTMRGEKITTMHT